MTPLDIPTAANKRNEDQLELHCKDNKRLVEMRDETFYTRHQPLLNTEDARLRRRRRSIANRLFDMAQ